MISKVLQAVVAIIVIIIGESIIVALVNDLGFTGFVKFLFIIALPLASILGIIALFRR